MEREGSIDLYRAIDRMRALSDAGVSFTLEFRKWDSSRRRGGDLRRVERAALRAKAADDAVAGASHKLFIRDLDTGDNLTCWHPLIVGLNGMRVTLS